MDIKCNFKLLTLIDFHMHNWWNIVSSRWERKCITMILTGKKLKMSNGMKHELGHAQAKKYWLLHTIVSDTQNVCKDFKKLWHYSSRCEPIVTKHHIYLNYVWSIVNHQERLLMHVVAKRSLTIWNGCVEDHTTLSIEETRDYMYGKCIKRILIQNCQSLRRQ